MAFICSHSSVIYSRVTQEIFTRKNFAPTKYPREKMLNPRNTPEKKILGPPTYSREKTFGPTKYPREKKSRTHKILTRKRFRLTKHPREKCWDPHFSTLVSILVGIVLQGGKELENTNF